MGLRISLSLSEAPSHVRPWPGGRSGWQALAVCVLAVLLYASLYSELPIDDAVRFTPYIAAGIFEWDASHLLMQPAVVLWHRYLSLGGPAIVSQERFNTFCAALSLGLLYLLLLRLGVGAARRVLLTALAAFGYNLLNLATSGHIKLAVLPFLTLSLFHATLWEDGERAGGSGRTGLLAAAAVELGIAAGFLINSVLVAPFLALAVLGISLRAGRGPRRALGLATVFGVLCGGTALAILGAGYALATPGPHGIRGLLGFLLAKSSGRGPSTGIAETLARGVFGGVQNFVFIGDFGAMLRTWMNGDSSFLPAYRGLFLGEGAVFLAALTLFAWIYLEALLRLARGRGAVAAPLAFVLGAFAFAVPWNLNEADFYFQITIPVAVLMATAPPAAWRLALQTLLLALVVGTVLSGWALPKKRYPLRRYEAELRSRLTPRDLTVCWFDYSGGPSLIFLDLPGVPRLHPDRLYEQDPDPDRLFARLAGAIDSHLAVGGRVYLFGILEDRTWHAPWPILRQKGLTQPSLKAFFQGRYTVTDRGEVAGIHCWELLSRRR